MPMLFEVTVARKAYVLAETAGEAKKMQRDIERWEDYLEIETEPWSGGTLSGWDDGCLVYHAGKEDISLGDAKKMAAPNVLITGPRKRRTRQRRSE